MCVSFQCSRVNALIEFPHIPFPLWNFSWFRLHLRDAIARNKGTTTKINYVIFDVFIHLFLLFLFLSRFTPIPLFLSNSLSRSIFLFISFIHCKLMIMLWAIISWHNMRFKFELLHKFAEYSLTAGSNLSWACYSIFNTKTILLLLLKSAKCKDQIAVKSDTEGKKKND